jgi:hypothetical protein
MSEQQAEQVSESGSLSAGPGVPHSADAQSEPVAALVPGTSEIKSPGLVPEQTPELDAPKADAHASKADAPKADVHKPDARKAEVPRVGAPEADAPRSPGKVLIMSPSEHVCGGGDDAGAEPETEAAQGMFRLAVLVAVVALAVLAGALGGALATAGFSQFTGDDAANAGDHALEASVARIDAEIQALKASVDHTSKLGMMQINKTSDRLDKIEKAQAEPAAKLAKLSEAVDKLRATPPVAPAPIAAASVAAKEITGSISPAAAAAAPKVEVARLPRVEGWLLRDVANGGALIEGRQGIFEVYAGDPVPGLGRVDAIRRQDGRWVVVTTRGLIVAR